MKKIQKQDSNLRLSRTVLLDMSEFFIKDKDRYIKSTNKIEIKQIQKQDSDLWLNRSALQDMNKFLITEKNKTREKTNLLNKKIIPTKGITTVLYIVVCYSVMHENNFCDWKFTITSEAHLKTMSSFSFSGPSKEFFQSHQRPVYIYMRCLYSFSGPSVIVNRRNEVWLELDADIWVDQRRWTESFVRKVFIFDSWFRVHIVTWRIVVTNIKIIKLKT